MGTIKKLVEATKQFKKPAMNKINKLIFICLFVQNASAVKLTDKNNNCFNMQQGRRHIALQKTECNSQNDLVVDEDSFVKFEESCIKLRTQLFFEKVNCTDPNSIKYDALFGF